jgi:phage terminase large subunit
MRTTGKLIFDYNPSDADSWVYQLPIDDKVVIKSTYKDNPFLEKAIRRQIEDLKYTDEVLYQIYALGEQAVSRENVYTKWEELTERPDRFREYIYGLDFGYQHPTALIKVWYFENEIYVEEVIYESYLTAVELVKRMEELEVSYSKEILADYARPEMIAELRSAGYYVLNADKSVEEGISAVRMSRVYVDHNSKNIIKENRNYKHKKIKGEIRDKEIDKRWDDAMDAIRYAKLWIKKYSTDGISETLSLDI